MTELKKETTSKFQHQAWPLAKNGKKIDWRLSTLLIQASLLDGSQLTPACSIRRIQFTTIKLYAVSVNRVINYKVRLIRTSQMEMRR